MLRAGYGGDLPVGGLLKGVSSPVCKNISPHPSGKSSLQIRAIPSHRGAYRDRHGRGVGCGGRGSVLRACGPDAPTLASSSRMLCRPYRARIQRWSANDGDK
jgi:hypothetical protein